MSILMNQLNFDKHTLQAYKLASQYVDVDLTLVDNRFMEKLDNYRLEDVAQHLILAFISSKYDIFSVKELREIKEAFNPSGLIATFPDMMLFQLLGTSIDLDSVSSFGNLRMQHMMSRHLTSRTTFDDLIQSYERALTLEHIYKLALAERRFNSTYLNKLAEITDQNDFSHVYLYVILLHDMGFRVKPVISLLYHKRSMLTTKKIEKIFNFMYLYRFDKSGQLFKAMLKLDVEISYDPQMRVIISMLEERGCFVCRS